MTDILNEQSVACWCYYMLIADVTVHDRLGYKQRRAVP